MAKGTMTQEDFEAGLSETEGFAGLKKAAKRDSPFGSGKVLPKKVAKVEGSRARDRSPPSPTKADKPREVSRAPDSPAVQEGHAPAPESQQRPATRRYKDPSLESVPFSFREAYRDRADLVARSIQRRKSGMGGDRFTACTLYRVFSEIGLDHFEWREGDFVRTEAELKDLICERLGLRREK